MIRISTIAQVLSFCVIAQAMSSSLMADIKEVHMQSPLKTNKVKRAQEFIMFGNQQNRASSTFGNPKSEKRASSLDDNSLNEDEEPTRSFPPAEEDRGFESNQLSSMDQDRAAYPHMLRDLYYSLLLRNMDLGQTMPKDSAYMDLPLYSYVEDRPKRDTKSQKTSSSKSKPTSLSKEKPSPHTNKNKGDRTKRDSLSQDLITLIKLMEAEKSSKEYPDPRDYLRYYTNDAGAGTREDFNELFDPIEDEGQWYDPPAPPSHVPRDRDGYWVRPPPHKRFMVSKRRYVLAGNDPNYVIRISKFILKVWSDPKLTSSAHIPLIEKYHLANYTIKNDALDGDESPLSGQDVLLNYLDGVQARRRFMI